MTSATIPYRIVLDPKVCQRNYNSPSIQLIQLNNLIGLKKVFSAIQGWDVKIIMEDIKPDLESWASGVFKG